MKKNNKFNRRKILIGASALTTAGLLISCKENVKGEHRQNQKVQLLSLKI